MTDLIRRRPCEWANRHRNWACLSNFVSLFIFADVPLAFPFQFHSFPPSSLAAASSSLSCFDILGITLPLFFCRLLPPLLLPLVLLPVLRLVAGCHRQSTSYGVNFGTSVGESVKRSKFRTRHSKHSNFGLFTCDLKSSRLCLIKIRPSI